MGEKRCHPLSRLFADDQASGLLAGILSAASIGVASFLIHLEASELSAGAILLACSLFGLGITLPLVWGNLVDLLKPGALAIWVRAVAGAASQLAFMWNLQHTSVGLANVLFNFSLFLTVVIGCLVGETIFRVRTFAELGLIVAGTWLYWYAVGSSLSSSVVVVGLMGAVAAAGAYAALKKAARIADPWLINWAVCVASIPVSFFSYSGGWGVPSGHALLILLLISVSVLAGQYLLVLSFARLPLSLATALIPSCVVWSVIVDSLTTGIGSAVQSIAGSAIYALGIGSLVFDSGDGKRDVDRHPPT
jgi:drug/metabolite transporter (DMT)-like permease